MGDCTDSWQIVYVPGESPVSPTQQATVGVVVSEVEPKAANQLIRRLNQISPLDNLRHVKRIRKIPREGNISLSIIICLTPEAGGLSSDLQELITINHLQPYTAKVCKFAANTKEEWEEQCKLWPTSYHPPIYNVEGVKGFGDADTKLIHKYMKMAIDLAKSYDGSVVNAAVIVDPSTKHVVADGIDESSPCLCVNPFNWRIEQQSSVMSWHPFRHAAMVAIESSAEKNIQQYPEPEGGNPNTRSALSKRQKTCHDECEPFDGISVGSRPYLCTGYDVFIVWEPCAMCSMALVHQRTKRIFYAFPNAVNGALCSVRRLHGLKSLNHHYAVFRVAVPDDAVFSV